MVTNKLTLFIIDDNIPKLPEFVEKSVYDGKLNGDILMHLLHSSEWKGQYNLKELTYLILNSEHVKSGEMKVFGFTHPSLSLDSIDEGLIPNIVIYDWEYTSESPINSSKWLTEILESTDAFVFVYSKVRNDIPVFLNKQNFDKYSNRFQLFLKGDTDSSVFSSEEFIHQYIVSQLSRANKIRIRGVNISFQENGYLKNPSDILYLEKILGRISLRKKLESEITQISNESIEKLIEDININIYYDEKKCLLITSDSQVALKNFELAKELTVIDVLQRYGLLTLEELLEIGIVKVI